MNFIAQPLEFLIIISLFLFQLVQMYEEENETDSDEVKGQRFEKIMQHMQKVCFALHSFHCFQTEFIY